jgi:hypothetical protein
MEKGLFHLFFEVNSLEHLKVWKSFGYFDPRRAQEQTTWILHNSLLNLSLLFRQWLLGLDR